MHPRLRRLADLLDAATRGVTLNDLQAPRGGRWTVAELLEHLALTYTSTTKGMSRVLAAGRPLATGQTLYQRIGTAIIACGHMPRGRRAPQQVVPRGMPAERIVEFTRTSLLGMDAVLTEVEARFGRARVLDHPVLGAWKVNMWRRFHLVHGRHHLRQIERYLESDAR